MLAFLLVGLSGLYVVGRGRSYLEALRLFLVFFWWSCMARMQWGTRVGMSPVWKWGAPSVPLSFLSQT